MFSKKSLRVEILRQDGYFYEEKNTLSFKDLPIEVKIDITELMSGFSAIVKIYGVSKEHLDMITTLQWYKRLDDETSAFIDKKFIRIFVNDGMGEYVLFEGDIMSAKPVYETAPDVHIEIEAVAGAFFNMISEIPPSQLVGKVPAPKFYEKICSQYGVQCIIHGEEKDYGQCIDPRQEEVGLKPRIDAATKAYGGYALVFNNRVEIFPSVPKEGENYIKIFTFTPENYIGYPSFIQGGIKIRTDELVNIMLRDIFKIKNSQVTPANDAWRCFKISYNLSTKIGGKWFMEIVGSRTTDE